MISNPRILVLGRNPAIMERVTALLGAGGYVVQPCFTDDEARAALERGNLDGFLIGGGVEAASRAALAPVAAAHGVIVIEHFGGPHALLEHVEAALSQSPAGAVLG